MDITKINRKSGFAQIFVLAGMLLISAALPIATKLVQQNQENRSNAASKTVWDCLKGSAQGVRTYGTYNSQSSCKSACSGGTCKSRTVTTVDTTPPKCTYTYSSWSPSVCPSSEKQTRNIVSRSPDGCSGGTAVLSRTCTYTPSSLPTCASKGGTCISDKSKCNGDYSFNASDCGQDVGGYCCIPKSSTDTKTTGCNLNSKNYKDGETTCSGTQEALCVDGGNQGFYWKYTDCPNGCSNGKCINSSLPTCASKGGTCISDKSKCNGDYSFNASDCGQDVGGYCCIPKSSTSIDGVCGSANGGIYSSAPTSNLCKSGTVSWGDQSGTSGYFYWYCSLTKCSATKANAKATCGSANGNTFTSASFSTNSSSSLCSAGQYVPVDQNGTDGVFNWKCTTSSDSVSCSAKNSSTTTPTCTYTCTSWSTCKADSSSTSGGTQSCTSENRSPSECTGGTHKVGTTRNCSAVLSTCASKGGTCMSDKSKCNGDYSIEASDCGGKAGGYCCVPTSNKKVDGVCSTVKNTCKSGTVSGITQTDTNYIWYCGGTNGGKGVLCTLAKKFICYPNGKTECSGNTLRTCVNDGETAYWDYTDCPNGCSNGKCITPATAVDGVCGSANGGTYSSAPTSSLCSVGTVYWTDQSGTSGSFNWVCKGINGGDSVKCNAKISSVATNENVRIYSDNCDSIGGKCVSNTSNCKQGTVYKTQDCISFCCVSKMSTSADVNNDGKVNSVDFSLMKIKMASYEEINDSLSSLKENSPYKKYDVNNDNVLNSLDLLLISNYIL